MRTLDLILYVAAGICFGAAAVKATSKVERYLAVGLLLCVAVRILDLLQPIT